VINITRTDESLYLFKLLAERTINVMIGM